MNDFEKMKEHFQAKNYFLVKDYVVGFTYIVDRAVANYLFGRSCDNIRSDCLFNCNYFSSTGIAHCDTKELMQEHVILFRSGFVGSNNNLTPSLKERIKDMNSELRHHINVQTRAKTARELKDGRTVRLIGCYHSLEQARKDYRKVCAHKENSGHCQEEEKVIIMHTGTKIPKDFKGKVTMSPSYRNFI